MFAETPTRAHVLVNAVLCELYERRPFKHDLADMETEHPDYFEEMLAEMLDSVRRVLAYGDYRKDAAPREFEDETEAIRKRMTELEEALARLKALVG